MAKRLRANVAVGGTWYGPDYRQPPAEVAEKITHPNAWEEVEEQSRQSRESRESRSRSSRRSGESE
jgi:hypothetical protein